MSSSGGRKAGGQKASGKAPKATGQIRSSQAIYTYGPGALIDLPHDSGIMGGLDFWPKTSELIAIEEPRLANKLTQLTGVAAPRLYAPPPAPDGPGQPNLGIRVWRFPEWFIVQEEPGKDRGPDAHERSRRLVHRKRLDEHRRFDGRQVVATRFIRACPRGHIDDLNWSAFVHGPDEPCRRQLWLDERGTSGDLAELWVRCECGTSRRLSDAGDLALGALGPCSGKRPWLGPGAAEPCGEKSRLLVRTASNAYFPQVLTVLSLPDRGSEVEKAVGEVWDVLMAVGSIEHLEVFRRLPKVDEKLAPFSNEQVMDAIRARRQGPAVERPVKQVELEAILAAAEGYGDDGPIDPDFHVRRLPDAAWRRRPTDLEPVEAVYQLHRLREVSTLVGFSRFEAVMPDINGEYDTDVKRAPIQAEPSWFPAVENRGEGVFVQLRAAAVNAWLERPGVAARVDALRAGHERWSEQRGRQKQPFYGGPYVLLHTLSHLLLQALAMKAGYAASSIRERIYVEPDLGHYGILLYTGTSDAEGTLGGLVGEARHLQEHLEAALRSAALCSNDPICAQHSPENSLERRWLHGAACHGCTLISETSCEMRNEYLDRALVVPVLGLTDAALFGAGL